MKKIMAGVISMSDDSLYTQFYCVGADGSFDSAVSATLCRAVGDLLGPELDEFLRLLDAVSSGNYPPGAPDTADICTNSTAIWLRPPQAPAGHVLIAGSSYAKEPDDDRRPQLFTYEQIRITAQHAVKFERDLETQGEENLVGQWSEVDLPD